MFEGLFRPGHLVILLVIVLLVFGPQKLPQLGSALGKTIRDFKQAFNEPPRETSSEASKSLPPPKDAQPGSPPPPAGGRAGSPGRGSGRA